MRNDYRPEEMWLRTIHESPVDPELFGGKYLTKDERKKLDTWVYFIQAVNGGPIKIGFAKDVKRRLRGLQTSHPYELVVLKKFRGTRWDEYRFHSFFMRHRLMGEWFEPAKELTDLIASPNFDDYLLADLNQQLRPPTRDHVGYDICEICRIRLAAAYSPRDVPEGAVQCEACIEAAPWREMDDQEAA